MGRAARLFVILTLTAITLVSAAFVILDATMPSWFLVVGRWVPALVTLLVLRLVPLPGGVPTGWALRPGGERRLFAGAAATVGLLVAAYGVSVAVLAAVRLVEPQPWSALGQVALLLVPMILLFSLSTLGEEAAWRGFLQRAWSGGGFWRTAIAVSAVWVLFHVPLHGAMALQGTLPWDIAIVTTLGLFPLGIFLSAAVHRFGSVWPAVFGHALPFSALSLVTDVDGLPLSTHWVLATITAAAVLAAAVLLVRGRPHGRPVS